MIDDGLTFEEKWDVELVLQLSLTDQNTLFPEIKYGDPDASQVIFFIKHRGIFIGFGLVVITSTLEIFRFFIIPSYRAVGISIPAARGLIDLILEECEQELVPSPIDDHSYHFWLRTLDVFDYQQIAGTDKFIVRARRLMR